MEHSKHNHRKKHSRYQDGKRSTAGVDKLVNSHVGNEVAVSEKVIERPRGSELQKYATNILGPYTEYQSAVEKMDMNEQMFGVAEAPPIPTAKLKHTEVQDGRSATSSTKTLNNPNYKKEKLKRKHRDSKPIAGEVKRSSQEMPSILPQPQERKKKASVRPYKNSYQTVSEDFEKVVSMSPQNRHTSYPLGSNKTPSCVVGPSSKSYSVDQNHPSDDIGGSENTNQSLDLKQKKVKKSKKRKNNLTYKNDTRPTSVAQSSVSHPQPAKQRPEALSLSMNDSSSISGYSDVPDTGDVRNMLQELMYPQPLSFITPIPTPNKVQPFVFPSQSSSVTMHKPLFKTPEGSNVVMPHSTATYQKLSSISGDGNEKGGTMASAVTSSHHEIIGGNRSGRSSSSSSSSSRSSSSSSSSSSSCSSREQSPDRFSEQSNNEGNREDIPEEKDEGTRLTLEKLQQFASTDIAITPLKKTPPHFMLNSDELANLSPAKHKSTASTHSGPPIPSLATQSSLGFTAFQPINSGNMNSEDSSGSDSDSSSMSTSEETFGDLLEKSKKEWKDEVGGGQDVLHENRHELASTLSMQSFLGNEGVGSIERKHYAAQPPPNSLVSSRKTLKKKRKSMDVVSITKKSKSDNDYQIAHKVRRAATMDDNNHIKQSMDSSGEVPTTISSLLVQIPLADLKVPDSSQQQIPKPKATVEPYNVRTTTSSRTPNRRNTTESIPEQEDVVQGGREHYSRIRNEDYATTGHDYHAGRGERSRVITGGRWEREPVRDRRTYGSGSHGGGRGNDYGRGHGWEREHYRGGPGGGEEYWSDTATHYEGSRGDPQRTGGGRGYARHQPPERKKGGPEYYMQEARQRKKKADKIMIPGLEKARLYMESVTYFMRHGGAIEHEQQGVGSGPNQTIKRNPYKMYSDTVSMIKYCQNMAGECKPLLVLCLRCQSALYWRMYLIKQPTSALIQKDLQEYFIPPKGGQSKSPFPGGFSPLPSPASVGSTASTSSGGGGSGVSHTDTSSSVVPIPRHVFNKAVEHIAISSHFNTCLELWQQSDSYMEQCKEFFLNADRKAGLTIHYYSSVFQVASWVENILRSF